MDGIELWIRQPGSPLAARLFVGRLEGMDDPVVALVGDAGHRVLAVLEEGLAALVPQFEAVVGGRIV